MILKHRDREVLRFEWLEPYGVHIVSVNESELKFLPLEMKGAATDEALWAWLKHRTVPKQRAYIFNFLSNIGLKPDDVQGIIRFCRGLSLNDVHWVSENDDMASWSEVNLYSNDFSETLAFMAFAGVGERFSPGSLSPSPELTTNGMLAKCWRRKDGVVSLYKSGTEGAANAGFEPYSEFYAAQIAEVMGLDHVGYGLAKFKGRLCSTCPLFTSDKYGYASAGRIAERGEAVKDPRFAELFLFDAIICNPDRHMGNFGYLVNNDTNEVVGAAPIFDNGYGLFALALDRAGDPNDDFGDLSKFMKRIAPALYANWLDIPGGITEAMKSKVRRLVGFRFKRHANYNLSTRRLRLIEDFLQKRVTEIIDSSARYGEDVPLSRENDTVKSKMSLSDDTVLQNIKADPFITAGEMAEILGVGLATVKRRLGKLQQEGRIKRVGSDKTGHWEVL